MEVVRCTREAEEYFNTQNDLITQQIQKYPPPPPLFKTKYDECISNNTAKANLLLSALSSKKLLATADCLENGANNYTFNSTLVCPFLFYNDRCSKLFNTHFRQRNTMLQSLFTKIKQRNFHLLTKK